MAENQTAKPFSVLFVCLGNTCRSTMSEGILRYLVKAKGLQDKWLIDSAGIADWHKGKPPDEFTVAMLERNGMMDGYHHTARQIRTGRFLRLQPCKSTALLSVGHQDQTMAAGLKSLFLITQTQHRKMSDAVGKSLEPSSGSTWMEKVKAFLTKTDNPTKLPLRQLQAAGSILILSISDYVSYEELLDICNLDDTFYSFYKLLELHTWMMLHRLRQDDNDGLVAGMAFVDAMWRDLEPRLKIAGAQMSQKTDGLYYLNNHFNSAIVSYDEALLVNDDKAMAHALWLNVFDGRDCDPRNLELLLAYTRKQMLHLHNIDSKTFLSGQKIEFLPIELDDEDKKQKRRPKKQYHIPKPVKSSSIID